jgi:hypothetical protein
VRDSGEGKVVLVEGFGETRRIGGILFGLGGGDGREMILGTAKFLV